MGGGAARGFDCNARQAEGRKQCSGDDFAEHAHDGGFREGRAVDADRERTFATWSTELDIPVEALFPPRRQCAEAVANEVAFLTFRGP